MSGDYVSTAEAIGGYTFLPPDRKAVEDETLPEIAPVMGVAGSGEFDLVIVFPIAVGATAREKLAQGINKRKAKREERKTAEAEANPETASHVRFIVDAIKAAGLDTYCYLSVQRDEIICLVSASEFKLRRFADEYDIKLELAQDEVQSRLKSGLHDDEQGAYIINPIDIPHMPEICPIKPFEYIYGKYDDCEEMQDLYYRKTPTSSLFTKVLRTKIIYSILEAPKRRGGAGLEISKLIHFRRMICVYPMHERAVADELLAEIRKPALLPWNAPNFSIKQYFGEKIALNVVFMGHYSRWLMLPGFVGLVAQLIVWSTGNYSSPVLPFYAIFIAAWGVFMLEFWKRKETLVALSWGMTEFEVEEPDRPEFSGNYIKSFVDGKDTVYYPPKEKIGKQVVSQSIVLLFVLLVIGTVSAIYLLRFSIQRKTATGASITASVLNTVQIIIFNMIYQKVAIKLTDDENHRTDTMYEDAMITKLFIFQFINSFASFFFLAFIAQYIAAPHGTNSDYRGSCGAKSCMEPLALNILIIFGSRLTLSNFLDIFIPYSKYKSKIKRETDGIEEGTVLSPAEVDYMLSEYDTVIEGIQTYADSAIQYGFSMMFITALPIAGCFSLFSNHVKLKFNMWKLFTLYQRPIPCGAQDIGIWQSIFEFVTVIAVVTNAALVVFTMTVIPDRYSFVARFWIFVGFQWFMFFLQQVLKALVPDEPYMVEVQRERMAFINSKVINKTPDEVRTNQIETNQGAARRSSAIGNDTAQLIEDMKNGLDCGCCRFITRPKETMMNLDAGDIPSLNLQEAPKPSNTSNTSNPLTVA